MIIVNLKGGTGNQLFQYALGRHLAYKNNDTLKLDVDGLARANILGDIYRPFALATLNIEKNIATEAEVQRLKYPYGLLSKGWRWFSFKILRKTNILFDSTILDYTGDIYLDGYFQSPRYFADIRDLLLPELTLTTPHSKAYTHFHTTIQTATHPVAIHIRRGDYIKNPRVAKEFGVCSMEYYQSALQLIEAKIANPTYFVFSDDIEWVKEHLPTGEQTVFVDNPELTDVEELVLMSNCRHNIIANSSFSWWSAWLNQHNDKIVIAPEPWFDTQPYDIDLLPSDWLTLPK